MHLLTLLIALTAQVITTPHPIAQLRIEDFRPVLLEPASEEPPLARVRPGDVMLIFQIDGDWARGEVGWISLDDLQPEPAVVSYGAAFDGDLMLPPSMSLSPDETVGVAAIFYDLALVYGRDAAGWTALDDLQLIDPTPDLVDFVQREAYVMVEAADFFAIPDSDSPVASQEPLGRRVHVLFSDDEWALVKSRNTVGWSQVENFDVAPGVLARGTMNAGPVNVRDNPVDGAVLTIVDFQEEVRILEHDGDWLYVRLSETRGALEGWLAAQFVDFEIEEN